MTLADWARIRMATVRLLGRCLFGFLPQLGFVLHFFLLHCSLEEFYDLIWCIFRHSIIHVCGIMSYVFLSSIHVMATFFLLVFTFFRICWSFVHLIPLKHPYFSAGYRFFLLFCADKIFIIIGKHVTDLFWRSFWIRGVSPFVILSCFLLS